MKKILIINLRRNGDLYFNAHLINSLLSKDFSSQIELLAFKEFEKATKNISGISKVHTIDRKELLTITQNSMFSNTQALNTFMESIQPLKDTQWDQVINISNDMTSCYLSSYLASDCENFDGIRFSNNQSVMASNDWASIYNDLLPSYRFSPVHFNDVYHKMCDTEICPSGEKISIKDKHTKQVFATFNKLRKAEGSSGACRVVGIQLRASHEDKEFGFENTVGLINRILDDITMFPVLLIAPIEEERVYAKQINKEFGDCLVIIESDFIALPSVIINLDALVTPDTVTKHIGDLVETPILEVSLGNAPLLKQGSTVEGNLILTPSLDRREWKSNDQSKVIQYLKPSSRDIYNSVKRLLDPEWKVQLENPHFALYQVSRDEVGTCYDYITGARDEMFDLSILMGRYYIAQRFQLSSKALILQKVAQFNTSVLKQWIVKEKGYSTDVSRELLGTLRSLLRTQKDLKKGREFVMSLDKLLKYTDTHTLSAIATTIFSAKLEAQSSSNLNDSIVGIEKNLYQLKSDIQLIIECTKDIENLVGRLAKDEMIARISPTQSLTN